MNPKKTYGPYRGKDGRARVVHWMQDGSTRSESYPRYLWRQHRGEIPAGMDVDHINGDRTDDRLENYQLLPHRENASKAFRDNPELRAISAANMRRNRAVRKFTSETAETRMIAGFYPAHIAHGANTAADRAGRIPAPPPSWHGPASGSRIGHRRPYQ